MKLETLKSKTARIAVVDPKGGVGPHIISALKRLGFTWFLPQFKNFGDFKAHPKRDQVNWIISTACEKSNLEAIAFFRDLYSHVEQPAVYWSLILAPDQVPRLLKKAFATGLLSWHPTSNNSDFYESEFRTLYARSYKVQDSIEVASAYLREHLVAKADWDELVNLEESLVAFMPESNQLVNQFRAYLCARRAGRIDYAWSLVKHLSPKLLGECQQLLKKFNPEYKPAPFAGRYRLGKAFVFANGKIQREIHKSLLTKLGFAHIVFGDDLESAWQRWQNDEGKYSLVLIESEGGNDAHKFLHRMMSDGKKEIPVVVIDHQFTPATLQLLRDFNVAQILKLPVSEKKFVMATAWSIVQSQEPSEIRTIENSILSYYRTDQPHFARLLTKRFVGMAYVSPIRKAYILSVQLYAEGKLDEALSLLMETCEGYQQPVTSEIWEFISHLLFAQKNHQQAIDWLRESCRVSPHNRLRRVSLAIKLLIMGESAEAGHILAEVSNWDQTNPIVQHAKACYKALTGSLEKIPSEELAVIGPVLSDAAIALALAGNTTRAVDIWKKLLGRAVLKGAHDQAAINYNLALCLFRSGDFQLAKLYVKNAMSGPVSVKERASELYAEIEGLQAGAPRSAAYFYLDTSNPLGFVPHIDGHGELWVNLWGIFGPNPGRLNIAS